MDHNKTSISMVTSTSAEPAAAVAEADATVHVALVPARDAADAPARDKGAGSASLAGSTAPPRAARKKRETFHVGEIIPPAETLGSPRPNLRPGDRGFGRTRHPPLPERVGAAASLVLDKDLGELVSLVLRGVKARSIPVTAARLLLERLLPNGRHIRLGLPVVRSADDLEEAHRIILQAVNDGRITPGEARTSGRCQ